MTNIARVAASSVVLAAGLGLAGLGASVAQAQPAPLPDYHWCPGEPFDPLWGNNWDRDRCHDDFYRDGDPRDDQHRFGGRDGYDENRGGRGGFHDDHGDGRDDHGEGHR